MTQVINPSQQNRQEWTDRVRALAETLATWCRAEGWGVEWGEKTIEEDALGTYTVPTLRVQVPGGELFFNPIALHVIGGDGRIDLEAFPTLARVKFIGVAGGWRIMTDSNVPLRQPWGPETFVQLVQDLVS